MDRRSGGLSATTYGTGSSRGVGWPLRRGEAARGGPLPVMAKPGGAGGVPQVEAQPIGGRWGVSPRTERDKGQRVPCRAVVYPPDSLSDGVAREVAVLAVGRGREGSGWRNDRTGSRGARLARRSDGVTRGAGRPPSGGRPAPAPVRMLDMGDGARNHDDLPTKGASVVDGVLGAPRAAIPDGNDQGGEGRHFGIAHEGRAAAMQGVIGPEDDELPPEGAREGRRDGIHTERAPGEQEPASGADETNQGRKVISRNGQGPGATDENGTSNHEKHRLFAPIRAPLSSPEAAAAVRARRKG